MNTLNPMQQTAITHLNGPMMVLAGPGSGKTYTITRRLEYMINQGIPPESILVITFTKASALEMEARFQSLMNDSYLPVNFGTFHAIFFSILKENLGYKAADIITEKEKRTYLRSIISTYSEDIFDEASEEYILSSVSKIKNDGIDHNDYKNGLIPDSVFNDIYIKYHQALKHNRKLDFDDMVLMCYQLLNSDERILEGYRARFKYILIDEFQDINNMQYKIVKLLSSPSDNLFIVGDDDQSIYGFRGSRPEIMLNFKKEYKSCKEVILSVNYRSTEQIVNNALRFIEHNKIRYKKSLTASKKGGSKIQCLEYDSTEDEYMTIINILKTSLRNGKLKDTAIIFRTNKAARNLTSCLSSEKIPYHFKEKPVSFFSHPVAQDILAILAFANGQTTRQNFLRFMNKPVRYISRSSLTQSSIELKKMLTDSSLRPSVIKNIRRLIYDLERISSLDVYSAINYIRHGMKYEDYIILDAKEKNKNITEIMDILSLIQNSARNIENYQEYLKFIVSYEESLQNSSDNDADEDRVTLITMHGSKGLEYKNVIIPDLNEGYVPAGKAGELEEERRVFYVAMTRAKDNLYLMYLKENKKLSVKPSRFIKELNIK